MSSRKDGAALYIKAIMFNKNLKVDKRHKECYTDIIMCFDAESIKLGNII